MLLENIVDVPLQGVLLRVTWSIGVRCLYVRRDRWWGLELRLKLIWFYSCYHRLDSIYDNFSCDIFLSNWVSGYWVISIFYSETAFLLGHLRLSHSWHAKRAQRLRWIIHQNHLVVSVFCRWKVVNYHLSLLDILANPRVTLLSVHTSDRERILVGLFLKGPSTSAFRFSAASTVTGLERCVSVWVSFVTTSSLSV